MKVKQCLSLMVAFNLTSALTLEAFSYSPALAQQSSAIGAPSYCYRQNMDDGLIKWTFVTHQYGTNYYRGQEIYGSRWRNVSCRESITLGGAPKGGGCIVGGIIYYAGSVIFRGPTRGIVKKVSRFATGCQIGASFGSVL